jgi:SAM-dependent methyltransferase
MASQLAAYVPKSILDIGCGSGDGIMALKAACAPNARIISCDDNPHCLEAARAKIASCGLSVEVINRLYQRVAGDEFHEMAVAAGKLQMLQGGADVTLVQADLIWDSEFLQFLKNRTKFDAITVWLIGTYDLKPQCLNLKPKVEGGMYRLMVQNKIYELGNEILRVGGVLQVVDRGESPKEEYLIKETIDSHKEQAQGTSLEVIGHNFKDYEELLGPEGGVPMVRTLGKSMRVPEHDKLAINSVISIKH